MFDKLSECLRSVVVTVSVKPFWPTLWAFQLVGPGHGLLCANIAIGPLGVMVSADDTFGGRDRAGEKKEDV